MSIDDFPRHVTGAAEPDFEPTWGCVNPDQCIMMAPHKIDECCTAEQMAELNGELKSEPFPLLEWARQLEICAIDRDSEPMRDDAEATQVYGSTCIGYGLRDGDGGGSIAEIITEQGRAADEYVARMIVAGLKAVAELKAFVGVGCSDGGG